MMEVKDLFTYLKDEHGHYNVHAHLAQMIALFGPPPMALLKRERSFRKLTFAPEIQNPREQPCKNAFQYFGGPFLMIMVRFRCTDSGRNFNVLTTFGPQVNSSAKT